MRRRSRAFKAAGCVAVGLLAWRASPSSAGEQRGLPQEPAASPLIKPAAAVQGPPLVVAHDGGSDFSIVVSATASPSEKYGAAELQDYFQRMSGAKLPVVTDEQPPPGHAILVGRSRAQEAVDPGEDWAALGDEGFVLKTVGGRIVAAGSPLRGSMYACNTLLETVGVRWYTPTVTVVPHLAAVAVPPLNETQRPAFEYREAYFTEALDIDWAPRLKLNGNFSNADEARGGKVVYYPFVHTFDQLVPPSLFATHPAYFPEIGGHRKHGSVQRCLSNPDVLRIATAQVRAWMNEHPEAKMYSVSQNDNHEFCECEDCRAIEKKYGNTHSGLYLWFVNQIAAAVQKDHPDKLIDTLAYQFTEAPPEHIKPLPNVRVRLCPIGVCEVHPYEKCNYADTEKFVENLRGWSHVTDQLYIWHYNTDFANYLMPLPNFNEFPADLRLYKSRGVRGVFFEGDYAPGGGGSDAELRSYVMAKCLWDASADSDALVTEWMRGVYGKAWGPMRAWFDELHHKVENPKDDHVTIYAKPTAPFLTADVLSDGDKWFNSAQSLAAGDATATAYVAKARMSLRYVKLMRDRAPAGELDAFLADARRMGIQQLSEGKPIAEWEKWYRGKKDHEK